MTFRKTALHAVVLAALVLPAPAGAQSQSASSVTAETLQAAQEYFDILSKPMAEQFGAQMSAAIWPLIERDLQGKVDAATLDDLKVEFRKIQENVVTMVLKDAPAIYAKHFTADELHELVRFYKAPTGQKLLQNTPQITADTVALLVPRMQEIQQQTIGAFEKVLTARGYMK